MNSTLAGWDNKRRPVQASYPPFLVQDHCVKDEEWQKFRLTLKGLPTHEKLAKLQEWWDKRYAAANEHLSVGMKRIWAVALITATEIQVENYLGALRRGGQLDANNQIRKYI